MNNISKEKISRALEYTLLMEKLGIHLIDSNHHDGVTYLRLSIPEKSTLTLGDKDKKLMVEILGEDCEDYNSKDGLTKIAKRLCYNFFKFTVEAEAGDDEFLDDFLKDYLKVLVKYTNETWTNEKSDEVLDNILKDFKSSEEFVEI